MGPGSRLAVLLAVAYFTSVLCNAATVASTDISSKLLPTPSDPDQQDKILPMEHRSLQESGPLAPALFVIGDSLADAGNNNYLETLAKSNFPPYGRQFASGRATGRFCNGKTAIDFFAIYLGLPLLKPYLDPVFRGSKAAAALLQGVNFASAGSGILDDTGSVFGQVITTTKQLQHFKEAKGKIFGLIGPEAGKKLLAESIFYVLTGNNDYINNYLLVPTKAKQYSPAAYQNLLISTFRTELTELYNMGARRLVVTGVPPLGCVPSQLVKFNSKGPCVQFVNKLASDYNAGLQSLLKELEASLSGSAFVYNNLYDISLGGILNPPSLGFEFGNVACCGVGRFNGLSPCLPVTPVCDDYKKYLFWDEFHPSEKFNHIITSRLFNGTIADSYPENMFQLTRMHLNGD